VAHTEFCPPAHPRAHATTDTCMIRSLIGGGTFLRYLSYAAHAAPHPAPPRQRVAMLLPAHVGGKLAGGLGARVHAFLPGARPRGAEDAQQSGWRATSCSEHFSRTRVTERPPMAATAAAIWAWALRK